MNKQWILILLASVYMIATGITDIDWMVISYRYSEWHRINELWEFAPYFKVNWYTAYIFTVLRLVIGSILLGILINEIWRNSD